MSLDELKLLAKLDEMVVEMLELMYFQGYGHDAGDYLMAAIKFVGWIQKFSDLPSAARALKGYRWLAPGMSRGFLAWVAAAAMMGVAMAAKDEEFAVMLVIQYVAYLRPSELCNLTAGQVIRLLKESGIDSWALLLAPQEELKTSKTGEFDESVLLDDRNWQSIDEIHRWESSDAPPLEPISGKVRSSFCQMGRNLGGYM